MPGPVNNDPALVRTGHWWISLHEHKNLRVTRPQRVLTQGGRATQLCVGNLTIIGSDNGLSPGRRQAVIWTNAGILLIGTLGINFSEISIEIHIFSFKKMHLKMSSAKWRLFCLCLNVLWWPFCLSLNESSRRVTVDNVTARNRWAIRPWLRPCDACASTLV